MLRMSRILAVLLLAGCSAASAPTVSDEDRSRFLFFAVLEGLWTDGPDPELLRPLVNQPRDHFVPKCPICTPVAHAVRMYVENSDVPVYGARGNGFPGDLADGLRSAERSVRLRALEGMVARYVDRRLARMSPAERTEMRKYLDVGKQDGMALMEPEFGRACPSCSGATGGKP
jgi:hypothetical protein